MSLDLYWSLPGTALKRWGTVLSTILHCTVLHCTALHYTVLHCTGLNSTALNCNTMYCTVLHSTALHSIKLYYTILHCTALQYTTLQSTADQYIALPCTLLLENTQMFYWKGGQCMTLNIREGTWMGNLLHPLLHCIALYSAPFTVQYSTLQCSIPQCTAVHCKVAGRVVVTNIKPWASHAFSTIFKIS